MKQSLTIKSCLILLEDGCSSVTFQFPQGKCPKQRVLAGNVRSQRTHQLRDGGGGQQGGDTQDKRSREYEKTDRWENQIKISYW